MKAFTSRINSILWIVFCFAQCGVAFAESLVIPPSAASTEGNGFSGPFYTPIRLQEVPIIEGSRTLGLGIAGFQGALGMAALCAITMVNVVVRYLTDESFAWTEEFSVFLLVLTTMAGTAAAAMRDNHIRIEFFFSSGSASRPVPNHATTKTAKESTYRYCNQFLWN